MFVGRERELKSLEDKYASNKFEFVVMRGRRRVGKSTLLKEFSKDKKDVIYFLSQERNFKKSITQLSKTVNEYIGKGTSVYDDFEPLFEDVFIASKEKRILLILDEFPYLANSDKSLMSILQTLIDTYHEESKLFLILCGSSISFMENKVLAYKAPLYGRSTGQMVIKPFFFDVAQKYFDNYSNVDKIIAYSIYGGIPAYLRTINNKKSIKENIIQSFLNEDGSLYDEPNILIKEELREPAVYNSIIEAIANGNTKNNEISTKVGEQRDKIGVYLKNLLELQIITREYPSTDKSHSKKSLYKLKDNLFQFWYRFISENKSKIEFDNDKSEVYDRLIKPYLEEYVGRIFEDICMEYFLLNISNRKNKLPFTFDKIGRWWDSNPKTKQEEEIDLLIFTNDNKNSFFVECKWRNEKVGLDILKDLQRKSELLNQFENRYYGICSKSGFKKDLLDYSEIHDDVYLYDLNDICNM